MLAAWLVGGVILFFWTGLAQNVLPWGVKSVRAHGENDGAPLVKSDMPTGMVFTTHGIAALIAARPQAYYNPMRYLALEFVTQLVVSAALVLVLAAFAPLDLGQRLLVGVGIWLVGFASIDLQYWNWWGFTLTYTVGIGFNRLMGYLLMVSLAGGML